MANKMRRLVWVGPILLVGALMAAWWSGGEEGIEVSAARPDPVDLARAHAQDHPGPGKEDQKGDDARPFPPQWWGEYPGRETLDSGEVITQSEAKGDLRINRAEGVIEAAPADVFAAITDYADYPDYMPDTVVCRIDERDGFKYQVHQEVEVAFKRVSYDILIEHQADGMGTSWRSTGGDLEVNEGSWSILQLGPKKCLVVYRLRLVPGFWIPQSIADRLLRRSLPGVIKAVRERSLQE